MKDELGLGYCGLVCGLCSENESCVGCKKGGCPEKDFVKIISAAQSQDMIVVANVLIFLVRIVFYTSYGLEHFVNLLDNMGKKN